MYFQWKTQGEEFHLRYMGEEYIITIGDYINTATCNPGKIKRPKVDSLGCIYLLQIIV